MYERCRALLAAGAGIPEEAERWAAQALAGAEASGIAGTCSRRCARAGSRRCSRTSRRGRSNLRAVWEHTQREGVDEPGAFPVAPDLVEALDGARRLDEARAVTARLRELAEQQEHPWGPRQRALRAAGPLAADLRRGRGRGAGAAAVAYERLGLRFDARARCSASAGRSAGSGSGAPPAVRSRTPRPRSTRLGSPGWPTRRARSSRASARGAAAGRRANAERSGASPSWRRTDSPTRRSRRRSSSPCTRSRCTSRTRTRSSASARGAARRPPLRRG